MKKFYDTNAILNLQEKIFEDRFIICSTTLYEIEHIKTSANKSEEIKFKARKIVRLLDEHKDQYDVVVFTLNCIDKLMEFGLDDTPDNQILVCAYDYNKNVEPIQFISDDICCKLIGREIFELDVVGITSTEDKEYYQGYRIIDVTEEQLSDLYSDMENNQFTCLRNEYVLLKDKDNIIVDKLKWTGNKYITISTRAFKSRMFGNVKPLDEVQMCAFDSIVSNDITVLYGKAGSGKTTIPLSYIIQGLETQKFEKCHIVYHFETLKGAKTLGFIKGDTTTKIMQTASIGGILSSKLGDEHVVTAMISSGKLNIVPTSNIRGVEFGSNDIVFVTEAQNLNTYTLKTIIQRCKEGCKQIYEGDILEQSDINCSELGIERMIDVFKGYEKFGCVKLKNNYRSSVCELADKL